MLQFLVTLEWWVWILIVVASMTSAIAVAEFWILLWIYKHIKP